MNISEEVDRSFGEGPPLPPVEMRVAAGRRVLVRRRFATGVAGFAAAAALATGWYAVGHDNVRGTSYPATQPTPTTAQDPSTDATERPWRRGELVRYVDGALQVRPGATVHEHLPNPFDYEAPALSDALDVTWRGQRRWVIIEREPGSRGISESSSTPSNGWASFADYVADQVDASVPGESGWPETFELDGSGRVVPTPGTTVFNRTDDPRLGPTFAPPGAATGAAVVTVAGEEDSYFVVWRVIDGSLDVITTPPDDVIGATFDELLTYARAQYASGEGLR